MQHLMLLLCSLYILLLNDAILATPSNVRSTKNTISEPQLSTRQLSVPSAYISSTPSSKENITQSNKQSTKQLSSRPIVQFTGEISSSSITNPADSFVGASATLLTTQDIIATTHSSVIFSVVQPITSSFASPAIVQSKNQSVPTRIKNITSTSQPNFSFTMQLINSSVKQSSLSSNHYTSSPIKVLPTLSPAPSTTQSVTSNSTNSSSFPPIRRNLTSFSNPAFSTITQSMYSSVGLIGSSSIYYLSPSINTFGTPLATSSTNKLNISFSILQSTTPSTGSTTPSTGLKTPSTGSTNQTPFLTNRSNSLYGSALSTASGILRTMTSLSLINPSISPAKSHPSLSPSISTSPTKDVHGSASKSNNQTPLIVGVTVGGTIVLLLVVILVVCYRRKRSSHQYNVFYDEQNIVMNPFDGPN